MIIGVPKEIKDKESRVSCTPASVHQLVDAGHEVLVEKNAGIESGFEDEMYKEAGAKIIDSAEEVWAKAEMIYKVKEPIESEYKYFREGLIIYTYLHLAADRALTEKLVENKCIGIAFETVQKGRALPLLKPMSEVAGRMAIQEGAKYLTKPAGGKGKLLQGVPGVAPAYVVVLGAGVVGTAATRIAVGMGARVTVLDVDIDRLGELSDIFPNMIETLYSNPFNIAKCVKEADMVVSTVLIPGHKAPKLVTEEMIKTMEPGSVVVDVAIDQGGSTELTENRPTTHTDPIFMAHDVVHYAVANIPGAVAQTSTHALSNATTKYGLMIANLGWKEAVKRAPELKSGVNTAEGYVTYRPVAHDLDMGYRDLEEIL